MNYLDSFSISNTRTFMPSQSRSLNAPLNMSSLSNEYAQIQQSSGSITPKPSLTSYNPSVPNYYNHSFQASFDLISSYKNSNNHTNHFSTSKNFHDRFTETLPNNPTKSFHQSFSQSENWKSTQESEVQTSLPSLPNDEDLTASRFFESMVIRGTISPPILHQDDDIEDIKQLEEILEKQHSQLFQGVNDKYSVAPFFHIPHSPPLPPPCEPTINTQSSTKLQSFHHKSYTSREYDRPHRSWIFEDRAQDDIVESELRKISKERERKHKTPRAPISARSLAPDALMLLKGNRVSPKKSHNKVHHNSESPCLNGTADFSDIPPLYLEKVHGILSPRSEDNSFMGPFTKLKTQLFSPRSAFNHIS